MLSRKIVSFIVIFLFTLVANLFFAAVFPWMYARLSQLGVPPLLIEFSFFALSLVVLLEIVLKFLLWQALPPLKFVSASPEKDAPDLNRERLERYTIELEELGFVQLMDYTSPSIQGMARLFAHPKQLCFAEIGCVKTAPMFCSISSYLQQNWCLAVTNLPFQTLGSAIRYAFLREPQIL